MPGKALPRSGNRATLRPAGRFPRSPRTRGFTLLEILVVIALLGLMTGLALPRLDRLFDSLRFAFERDDVVQAIGELPFIAFQQGRAFSFTRYPPQEGDDDLPLNLPEGWTVHADQPIVYRANGVCGGGVVTFTYAGRSSVGTLAAPLCQPAL